MVALEEQLITLLYLLAIATIVGLLTERSARIQYTNGLLIAGIAVSAVGSPIQFELTPEFILLVLLPALIFEDAVTIDVAAFRENLVAILALAIVGLLLSIAVVAVVGPIVFGFSVAVAILFGAIVMPTDPVSVLAVFEELGVPEQLGIVVEGESLLNDGVSIVVYSVVLTAFLETESPSVPPSDLFTSREFLVTVGVGIVVAVVGGILVGAVAGYVAAELVAASDDEMTAVVVSLLLAYGVYVLLDALGTSGVIGTLAAGMVFASRANRTAMAPETHATVGTTWSVAGFLANTALFVAIGIVTPWPLLVEYGPEIVAAIVLVFFSRAIIIYPLVGVLNRFLATGIPRSYQHVLTWSGIHASVSIALVLDVGEVLPEPLTEQLYALVFGVAAFTLLVNGQTMGGLVDRLGINE